MTEVRCHNFETGYCTSCSLLQFSREEELRQKFELVRERVALRLASGPKVFPVFSPKTILPSRSKAKLSVSGTIEQPIVGLLSFDGKVVRSKPLLDCPLHRPELNQLLSFLAETGISQWKLSPFDPLTRKGELKGLIVVSNADASQLMLRWICRSRALEHTLRKASIELLARFPNLRVVSMNIQSVPQAVLEGPEEILLTKDQSILEDYGHFQAEFGPQSFKQVTHETAQALYERARDLAAEKAVRHLLDLYCGSGAFALSLARVVQTGRGIELSPDAVECAKRQSREFPHLTFEAADADFAEAALFQASPDLLVVNPPRRGLSPRLIQAIGTALPERILYSSCSVETLGRDLALLEANYQVRELHPFDMFPQTAHLETLALLERKETP